MPDIDKQIEPADDNQESLARLDSLEEKISSAIGFMMGLDEKLDDILFRTRVISVIVSAILGCLMILVIQ